MPEEKNRRPSSHFTMSKEVKAFQARMKEIMPEWREAQIQAAHRAFMEGRTKPVIRQRVRHPVLIGDLL